MSLGRVGSIQLTFADSSVSARWKVADWVSRVVPQSSRSMGQASRNVVNEMTSKVNATRAKKASKATSRTSLVVLLVLCLLTEGYAKTTLSLPTRFVFLDTEEQMIEVYFQN